jgi:hypothetical protein
MKLTEKIIKERQDQIKILYDSSYNSKDFEDGLKYLYSVRDDYFKAFTAISLMGIRFNAHDKFLLLRYSNYLVESAIVATDSAYEGLQNACLRELRYLIETSVKFLSLDSNFSKASLKEKATKLNNREVRFEDYVKGLNLFEDFSKSAELKAEILSLYGLFSLTTHPTKNKIEETERISKRGKPAGSDSLKSLNKISKTIFKTLDISLVLLFHSLGQSMAGDIFIVYLDEEIKWKFHKGRFTAELSKCFDYKAERKFKQKL